MTQYYEKIEKATGKHTALIEYEPVSLDQICKENGLFKDEDHKKIREDNADLLAMLDAQAFELDNVLYKRKWVSVTDRLPIENYLKEICLKHKQGGTYCAFFKWGQWNDCDNGDRIELSDFTHWYDLPPPPSEDAPIYDKEAYKKGDCVICGANLWLRDCDAGSIKEMYRVCSEECESKLPKEPSEDAEPKEDQPSKEELLLREMGFKGIEVDTERYIYWSANDDSYEKKEGDEFYLCPIIGHIGSWNVLQVPMPNHAIYYRRKRL